MQKITKERGMVIQSSYISEKIYEVLKSETKNRGIRTISRLSSLILTEWAEDALLAEARETIKRAEASDV